MAAHYEANKDRYREPARYKIATLTRATEAEAAEDYARCRAARISRWLARRNSTDEAKGKGGERDWIHRGQGARRRGRAMLDTLAIGRDGRPIETESGFMLIKLVGRERGAIVPPARVETHIRTHLKRVKELDAINETIRLLRRERARSKSHEETIKDLQITGRKG